MRTLILLFALSLPCLAADLPSCGTPLNSPGTYNMTADLVQVGAGTCLNIGAPNVVINGNGHSLKFEGVGINSSHENSEIYGIAFISTAYGGKGAYRAIQMALSSGRYPYSNIHDNTWNVEINETAPFYFLHMADGMNGLTRFSNNTGVYRNSNPKGNAVLIDFDIAHSPSAGFEGFGNVFHVSSAGGASNASNRLFAPNISTVGDRVEWAYNTIVSGDVGLAQTTGWRLMETWCGAMKAKKGPAIDYHHNTVTDYGSFSRITHFDGCDGAKVHDNKTILLGSGLSAGHRVRLHAWNVEIYKNLVDATGCPNCGNLISLCGSPNAADASELDSFSNKVPQAALVHDNTLKVNGAGMLAVNLAEGCTGHRIFNNDIEIGPLGGLAVGVAEYGDPSEIDDIELAHNLIKNAGGQTPVRFTQSPTKFSFCANNLGGANVGPKDVADGAPADGEPTFTVGPCRCETEALGCGPGAGVRSEDAGDAEPDYVTRGELDEARAAIEALKASMMTRSDLEALTKRIVEGLQALAAQLQ